jgi:hypothetical protein
MTNRKRLAALLFALTNYSLFAQNRHYQGNGFGFDYPSEWKIHEPSITRQSFEADRSQEKYDLVGLYGPGENPANIYLFYRKFPPGKMCGSVSQHIEGLFREELKTSYMNEHDSLESFPAGQAVTVKSDHSIRNRGVEQIATTVCGSEGDVAYVVFAYNADANPEGRNVILNSLRFAGSSPVLTGDWNGQGSVLTLQPDGHAEISFPSGLRNVGLYHVSNGRIVFSWQTIMSIPTQAKWTCSYSLSGNQLRMSCDPGGSKVYAR